IRSHDQFNTTIYGLDDRYRGIYHERRVIFMNLYDISAQDMADGDIVDIFSHYGGIERMGHNFIILAYSISKGCVATYFPETNVLVPVDVVADKSLTPVSKSVIVQVRKHNN